MKKSELLNELFTIPHLKLNKMFDVSAMLEDLNQISDSDFIPYESSYGSKISQDYYRKNWAGLGLIGNKLTEGRPNDLDKTEFYHKMPYFRHILDELNVKREARIMKIVADGTLIYHGHILEHGQRRDQLTIQIPIIMPDDFFYAVSTGNNLDLETRKIIDSDKVVVQRYKPGEMWVFNSYHYHNVFNRDPNQDRITLMMYMNIDSLTDLLEEAVSKYDGIRLPISESVYPNATNKKN